MVTMDIKEEDIMIIMIEGTTIEIDIMIEF